ncbi:ROK family transcriptional regulator [Streptomyces flavalbus]|uniref:ROK family protein n=1 Tax=Streptomyces flavalbus TaxID=2665155 RepID=A0ABW2W6W7_9ACTN
MGRVKRANAGAAATGTSGAGAHPPARRGHNAARVLDLLRTAGSEGISRLELAERTGLTPQAVSKITARLRADGLAAEAGRRASTGGKPRTVLRLVPDAGHAIGVHLDRDELRAVLVDLTGAVRAERRVPLDLGAGAEAVVAAVVREVDALRGPGAGWPGAGQLGDGRPGVGSPGGGPSDAGLPRGRRPGVGPSGAGPSGVGSRGVGPSGVGLLGVGVALPGPLDHARGVLHRVTGFPEWDGFPLRDTLVRHLDGLPVVVDKDTNAAALGLAVAAPGDGHQAQSFAYLHFGAGLGGGLVIGGAVHRGARTGAGEFGHQVVQLDGPPCGCGNRGCVEALCLAAVARGDIEEAARVLGTGTGNLVALLDIDLILLGGRIVATAPDRFVGGVAAALTDRARRTGGTAVPVRLVPGGGREVAEGAAQLLLAPLFGRGDGGG